MGDPQAPPLRVEHLLRTLDDHAVDFVVVGGLAAAARGATRVTFDIDVVPEWSTDNLNRLAGALRALNAELRVPGSSETSPYPLDASSLRGFEISTWRTEAGDLGIIVGTPTATRGTLAGYDELHERASGLEAYGITIMVAHLDDIIISKEALAREPDLVALPELRRLQARIAADHHEPTGPD